MLSELIEALEILLKYDNPPRPTHCEHDRLLVLVDPAKVSEEDKKRLQLLGFHTNDEERGFYSFRYGSA